ncbi:serine/threonine-protein kinase [Paracraurococcus lichenis]|uniref:Serine/threonine-protein kinase n=1 Tax=Paracraurococcus lichenis TaxID=3064888 RepID=A0ABT9E435_9PROT|nr:serine/threonine-protein kinase [Paracraurococcus sp. LOR1-02]MDO9710935.1 serine/threonine-protein kinase [Paracraurococcus sp. LOR1-02]
MLRQIAGRYEIRKEIGSGASAKVYEAFDTGALQRLVAVKVFQLRMLGDAAAQEEHARFRQGARAAGDLFHPNIVSVLDFGEDNECAWIVMELVDGETLRALLDRGVRLDTPAIVQLMGQILSALGYTHSRGVVHRDIKPENVMLTRDRVAKITDFGIARIEDASMTVVGTMLGSPAYMAPEQVLCEPVDHRADLWAAGVILYQLLTGERPFEGSRTTVGHKVLYAEPVLPSRTRAAVPLQFDAVVAKALAKQPEMRFGSAAEFATALRDAAAQVGPQPAATGAEPPLPRRGPAAEEPGRDGARTRPPPASRPRPPRRPQPAPWLMPVAVGGMAVMLAVGAVVFGLPAERRAEPSGPSAELPPSSGPALRPDPGPQGVPPEADRAPSFAEREQVPQPLAPVPRPPVPDPAPVPMPLPEPPLPAVPQRPDYRPAAAEALGAFRCGVVASVGTVDSVALRGFAPIAEIQAAQRSLAAAGVPAAASRMQVDTIGSHFCRMLAAARPFMEDEPNWQAGLDGPSRLAPGQALRVRVELPDWPAHVYLDFLQANGQVAHLAALPQRHPPRTRLLLTDPRWVLDQMPATELLLVVVSERPLFARPRPQMFERLDEFAQALGPALRAAQENGGRVSAQAFVVQTVPR